MTPRRPLVPAAAALALLACAAQARAQLPVSSRDAAGNVVIRATRITTPIEVDGKLDDEVYRQVEALTDVHSVRTADGRAVERADRSVGAVRRRQPVPGVPVLGSPPRADGPQ